MYSPRMVRPDLLAALEDAGYRVTGPRRRVVEALAQKEAGFSVEEVCAELPDVGRATVYRTVRILLERGAICRLAMPDGAVKYSLAPVEHHHHAICVRCGAVQEFRHATVERLVRAVAGDIAGQVVGHRIEFFVVCPQCQGPANP